MPHFRCFLLDSSDHILSVDSINAIDDANAMAMASQLLREKNSSVDVMEIWQEKRCVGRIANEAAHNKEA